MGRLAMFKHILVPTDGSALSEATAARAVSFAKEAGARITFFYAQPDFPMPIYGEGALIDPTTPEQFAKSAAAEAEGILSKAKQAADAAGVSADTDTLVNEVPYEAIIDAADRHGCDLIFMASHGRRGIAGLLLGSETQKVLTHSKTPVLVCR
ncbi:UspA [Thauera chlorobenzoica]|uniref:UspA n=2 Tax=Thauera chlorobenzoica TaxID=96773 RepID=A0A1L6FGH1_9RHOO|nr:UspA [Thauera chlorobenzoica]